VAVAQLGLVRRLLISMNILDQLKPHFELLDRYQSFAAELSRLSLLGVSAVPYVIASATGELKNGAVRFISLENRAARVAMLGAAVLFIISAALALLYRYYSTDSMASMVRIAHLEGQNSRDQRMEEERRFRNFRFRLSFWFLMGSSSTLIVAAALLIFSFAWLVKL
jgi:hypothetical protein